ncbi:MAG: hypothetical protein FJ368_06005 [Pelagibacterales bacterium]|nr:hypothetical protein [Pelagibacterales bacterium]
MKISDSVRKSIDDWEKNELESSMLHACNAVDGTAKKIYPKYKNQKRFTQILRDNYKIFGPMGLPGIDIANTAFPVGIKNPTAIGGNPDVADIIYSIHRCSHGHGDELPDGFSLLEDAKFGGDSTRIHIERGKLRLSDRSIFGLLAVAVFLIANKDQLDSKLNGYRLIFGGEIEFLINEWWGRGEDFLKIIKLHTP